VDFDDGGWAGTKGFPQEARRSSVGVDSVGVIAKGSGPGDERLSGGYDHHRIRGQTGLGGAYLHNTEYFVQIKWML
jgi:hypothetical protein